MVPSNLYENFKNHIVKYENLVCKICGKRPKYAFLPEVNAKADQLYWLCKECVENKDYANLPGVFQAAFTSMKSCVEKISKFFKRRENQEASETTVSSDLTPKIIETPLVVGAPAEAQNLAVPSGSSVKEKCHKRKLETSRHTKIKKKFCRRSYLEKSGDDSTDTDLGQTFVPRKSLSEINRTNNKGETCLHKLCSLGNIEEIQRRLNEGANPNIRDYTGETPLSEAVTRNALPVVKLLLKAGACVNTPAWKNGTPLMDAVYNDNLEMVELLLKYGADVNVRAVNNVTAMSCVKSPAVEEVLNKSLHTIILPEVAPKMPQDKIILKCVGLDSDDMEITLTMCRMLNIALCNNFTTEVSHLIVKDTGSKNIKASVDVLKALAVGAVIVNFQWVLYCIQSKKLVDVDEFEIHGTIEYPDTQAPRKSRLNRAFLMPRLFERCNMALTKVWCHSCEVSKNTLQALIILSGAHFLCREPDPDGTCLEETVMVNIKNPSSPLYNTTHIILYPDGKKQALKYNMKHVKSLPVSWFLKCLQTFRIHDTLDDYYS